MAEGHYVAMLDLADGCLQRGDLPAAAALGAARGVDRWEQEADRWIGRVVDASGRHDDAARHLAERLLDAVTSSQSGRR